MTDPVIILARQTLSDLLTARAASRPLPTTPPILLDPSVFLTPAPKLPTSLDQLQKQAAWEFLAKATGQYVPTPVEQALAVLHGRAPTTLTTTLPFIPREEGGSGGAGGSGRGGSVGGSAGGAGGAGGGNPFGGVAIEASRGNASTEAIIQAIKDIVDQLNAVHQQHLADQYRLVGTTFVSSQEKWKAVTEVLQSGVVFSPERYAYLRSQAEFYARRIRQESMGG